MRPGIGRNVSCTVGVHTIWAVAFLSREMWFIDCCSTNCYLMHIKNCMYTFFLSNLLRVYDMYIWTVIVPSTNLMYVTWSLFVSTPLVAVKQFPIEMWSTRHFDYDSSLRTLASCWNTKNYQPHVYAHENPSLIMVLFVSTPLVAVKQFTIEL